MVESDQTFDSEQGVYKNTIKKCKNYTIRFQRWNQEKNAYLPSDPSTWKVPPVAEKDVDSYFCVNTRCVTPGVPPSLVLSDWSDHLLGFLRANVGGDFFNASPERILEDFFSELDNMNYTLRQIRNVLRSGSTFTLEEKFKRSDSFEHFKNPPSTEDDLQRQLTDLSKQLQVLVDYISEKFEPLQDRLDLCIRHGQMEFDLLQYYFKKDDLLSTMTGDPEQDPPIAIKVTSTKISTIDNGTQIFSIEGEGYEWNGSAYISRQVKLECSHFEGTKKITSLPYVHLTGDVKEHLTARGRLYTACSGIHFLSYNDTRVIVDRVGWDHYHSDTEYGSTKFHKSLKRASPKDQKIPQIEEDQLCFLPAVVYGFDLENKIWIPMFVEKLAPISFDEGAWDHLVLDSKVKDLIKGLVEVTRQQNVSPRVVISDVIRGKGGGLACVLHGPPGTGKTLTAEAVAELLRRPLYVAGATELTTDPSELEKSLGKILDLATSWDAVVLIDEADVFLEQRRLNELQRNSLVNAVLRLLEYHRGVLFLTTNRIAAFDPAFMSRISIAIKYPELDQSSRFTVWSNFFQLAGYEIKDTADGPNTFTREVVEQLASKPFNGRTIKNIVRTAQALALASGSALTLENINVVVETQEKFLDDFAGVQKTSHQPY